MLVLTNKINATYPLISQDKVLIKRSFVSTVHPTVHKIRVKTLTMAFETIISGLGTMKETRPPNESREDKDEVELLCIAHLCKLIFINMLCTSDVI